MTFNEWLGAEQGRAISVAEHFKVSQSAVSQWRTNGVPRRLIVEMHEFTNRKVSLAELVRKPVSAAA